MTSRHEDGPKYALNDESIKEYIFNSAVDGLNKKIVQTLIDRGFNVNTLYDNGTPLHELAESAHYLVTRDSDSREKTIAMIKFLVSLGADPCIKNSEGKMPSELLKNQKELEALKFPICSQNK